MRYLEPCYQSFAIRANQAYLLQYYPARGLSFGTVAVPQCFQDHDTQAVQKVQEHVEG